MIISIHAPHARSDKIVKGDYLKRKISIHAPHARSDLICVCISSRASGFQSTLLMRGATPGTCRAGRLDDRISIHAPHARSDSDGLVNIRGGLYFNPRSSCEERPPGYHQRRHGGTISIHAPHARSDPLSFLFQGLPSYISIHAPHARSDYTSIPSIWISRNFNPRSSCEERRQHVRHAHPHAQISIHAPHARSDRRYFHR